MILINCIVIVLTEFDYVITIRDPRCMASTGRPHTSHTHPDRQPGSARINGSPGVRYSRISGLRDNFKTQHSRISGSPGTPGSHYSLISGSPGTPGSQNRWAAVSSVSRNIVRVKSKMHSRSKTFNVQNVRGGQQASCYVILLFAP